MLNFSILFCLNLLYDLGKFNDDKLLNVVTFKKLPVFHTLHVLPFKVFL